MALLALVLIPLLAGALAGVLGRTRPTWPRWLVLGAMVADAVLLGISWLNPGTHTARWKWIPRFGVELSFALDGLSVAMLALTCGLGVVAVLAAWRVRERAGFFFFNLAWVLAGIAGVFLARDLFLFYVFWELMLLPMVLLIGVFGHERRVYAAIKFFVFTQASGLLLLAAIIALALAHSASTGELTFAYDRLLYTPLAPVTARWLMLGFAAAFLVKLPAVPFHTWLPDAHTEAPTAGSVILAGLLLKTGAYGLLRFAVPLFPDAAAWFAPVASALGVAGILWGALLASSQRDLKRLVAYTSVSHMGFVLLGAYSTSTAARAGAVLEMICHGLSTGGLFFAAGALEERLHTRDLERLGGLWTPLPRLGAATLLFTMATIGLPGLGNFVAELTILAGVFGERPVAAALASVGIIGATLYGLRLFGRVFHGAVATPPAAADAGTHELAAFALLAVALLWLGLAPQPILSVVEAPLLVGARP
jgi:NADH-quinone oxidoreductase subunit M